jgi:hypothetical protein
MKCSQCHATLTVVDGITRCEGCGHVPAKWELEQLQRVEAGNPLPLGRGGQAPTSPACKLPGMSTKVPTGSL